MDLAAFVAARLDEDEAVAKAALANALGIEGELAQQAGPCVGEAAYEYIARYDPARALREVAAKRLILAEHEAVLGECHTMELKADRRPRKYGEYDGLHKAVVELAAIDRDHPDYDQEWAL